MKINIHKIIYLNLFLALISNLFSTSAFASNHPQVLLLSSKAHAEVDFYFKNVVQLINLTLQKQHIEYKKSPIKLAQFVDDSILNLWHAEKTLHNLLGKSIWKQLDDKSKTKLLIVFNNTIQRYVQEGFRLYDGQKIEFVDVKLNKKTTKGLVTIKLIPNVLPSFNVSFRIFKSNQNWYLYDAIVKGVSYVTLKKESFRKLYKNQGIKNIINMMNEKNKSFLPSSLVKAR